MGWNEKGVRGASLIAHQRREQIKIEEWKKESTEYKKPSRQASKAATYEGKELDCSSSSSSRKKKRRSSF